MQCAVAPPQLPNSPVFTASPRKFLASPSRLRLTRLQRPLNGDGLLPSTSNESATPIKRKRPARIDVPHVSLEFGEMTESSSINAEGTLNEVEDEGEGYSVFSKRGKRSGTAMEDRHAAVSGDKQAFFGVFDGHGGSSAADFAAKNLEKNIMKEISKRGEEEIKEAVKEGYLTTDSDFLKEEIRGGTCCATALIHKDNLIISNAGDCRTVMSRGGVAEALTVDHKPSLDRERERIENMGGYVDCCRGTWRVHGTLAVSRSIGDRHLKPWVTAEPETNLLVIEPDFEFLILASDGLWDKVSNQEAVDVVRSLCIGVDRPLVSSACKKLVDLSVQRGSADDITVMVVLLTRFLQRRT